MKVAITGMGIISAIGNTVEENFSALKNAQPGISKLSLFNSRHRDAIKVGEVKIDNASFESRLNLLKNHNFSRTALLGLTAAKEAVRNAGIQELDSSIRTGLISATSVGGMDKTEEFYYDYLDEATNRRFIEGHHGGDATQKIAAALGIKDYVTTISTACSSSANAIMLGARLIKTGQLDRVIVGGSDCLSKFTVNGFNTLMILSDEACQPFDEDRKGLNLGEAAAFLVLESEALVRKEQKKVIGYLSGYGNANDAFHQTASSENGEGATLAMKKALAVADLKPTAIDYINAHGTATPNNDLSESRAIINVFGDCIPALSSTKAFTGHTLAAAAAIEAVFSLLSLEHALIFPNLNFKTAIKDTGIIPITTVKEQALTHILSNSFGFGGNCSTLIFSKA